MDGEKFEKLRKLRQISTGRSFWIGAIIIPILIALNALSNITVHHREITFCSNSDRLRYCQMANEDPVTYGLSNEFISGLNRVHGTLFLCSNRQARGNKYAASYKNAKSLKQRAEVIKKNKENNLDWHSTVIYYLHGDLFYYDCNFDPTMHVLPEHCRTIRCLEMRSRLVDFIHVLESHGLPINRIMATGGNNGVQGSCRNYAIQFMKDLIESRIHGTPLTKYTFVQLTKGPREPASDVLDVLEEI